MREKHLLSAEEAEQAEQIMNSLEDAVTAEEFKLELLKLVDPNIDIRRADVYLSDEELARRGTGLHPTNRGGLVTYHGPDGQISPFARADENWVRHPAMEATLRDSGEGFELVWRWTARVTR